ncbi:MAG: DNA translocase FtsK 4TM domain-containing protein [Mailhella sp.]|nr:DNA translocase FtsK 4TM domain-containing protein [Mailhella sp.]
MYGHRLLRELIGLLFIFCGLLMLLSLWSYDIADPSFNQAVTIQGKSSIHNAAGLFGAYLAGSMVDVFGMASFLWIFFFLAVGSGLVSHWIVLKWYRWIGYLLLFACFVTIADFCDFTLHGIHGGGLAGKWLTAFSYLFFSPTGSLLIWIFVFLAAMELSFSISWLAMLAALLTWVTGKLLSAKTGQEATRDIKKAADGFSLLFGRFFNKQGAPGNPPKSSPMLDIMLPEKHDATPGETSAADGAHVFANAGSLDKKNENKPPLDRILPRECDPLIYDGTPLNSEENSSQNSPDFIIEEAFPVLQDSAIKHDLNSVSILEKPEAEGSTESLGAGLANLQETGESFLSTVPGMDEKSTEKTPEAPDQSPAPPSLEINVPEEAINIKEAEPISGCHPDDPQASPVVQPKKILSEEHFHGTGKKAGGDDAERAQIQDGVQEAAPHQVQTPVSSEVALDDEVQTSLEKVIGETMELQRRLSAEAKPQPAAPLPAPVLPRRRQYIMPSTALLDSPPAAALLDRPDREKLTQQGLAVIECLKNFHVEAELAKITPGPVVTMFELRPAPGVKATRITNLANDLAMSLKAISVRMQAPVPGTDTVGVEVPNDKRQTVYFREIIENEAFKNAKSLLTVALGKDIGGRPFSADLAKMPHLLVAGATGKGKSVCLNAILLSLLYRARPDEVKLILVDPKRVEFSMYADLPHLVHPVVTDMDITKNALLWAIDEMNRRLSLFSKVKVRNITGYNDRQAALREEAERTGRIPVDSVTGTPEDLANMPFLVIVVDELADLMQIKRKEVEGPIVRLAQLARAAGIHLIVATQRPSVDVVTGLIKANFPCRIAFQVTNGQDSRTILDCVGAEKLLGNGDMLFKPNGDIVQRLHGAYVSDREVAAMVDFWKRQQAPDYQVDFAEFGNEEDDAEAEGSTQGNRRGSSDIVDDPVYSEAIEFVLSSGKISISLLQRRFRIGFNRAARFVEQMEQDGIITSADGAKPRVVRDRRNNA